MSILALDPATKCGWAMLGDDDRVRSGVWDLSVEKGQHKGARYTFLRRHLAQLETVGLVAYERSMHLKGDAIMVHGGLVGAIEDWAFIRKIDVVHIGASSLKKYITGHGRAEKDKIAAVVRKRFGITVPFSSYDESDALAVLQWALDEHLGGRPKKPTADISGLVKTFDFTPEDQAQIHDEAARMDPKPVEARPKVVDLMQSLRESLARVENQRRPQ